MSRIVIALGGNALGRNLPEQMAAVKITSAAIADLIEDGHDVVITHGNGPQVGMIDTAMGALARADSSYTVAPLSVCVAMSQGYIGYDIQNSLREELLSRGIHKPVVSLITQVRVDPADPSFSAPSKPIGRFMTESEAEQAMSKGQTVIEDAGRGFRRVVASPKPMEIIEVDTVRALLDAGQVVVAAGGGGIPVVREGSQHLKGQSAVIDKDFASALLARDIGADMLIILTAVEKAAINFNTPDVSWLSSLTVAQAREYIAQKQFAAGSMLPKIEAALDFVASAPERRALITKLECARAAMLGKTGTLITR